jgi:hypothetical protein
MTGLRVDASVKGSAMECNVDWSQAPQGARWWVMDGDGRAHWFGEPEVILQTSFWFTDPVPAPAFDYVGDWRSSLVERPAHGWDSVLLRPGNAAENFLGA